MTGERQPNAPSDPGETGKTVQLLVGDAGNRSAISGMLEDQFDLETSQSITDADLYLIEDYLFPEYQAALREQVKREDPVFCPVVLIRRERTDLRQGGVDSSASDGAVRYDEVVDAPINPPQLRRRLHSLLVRRQQSLELKQQLSTLEEREQRLRRFEQGVESTGNGIVMTDSSGTIEYVNPALESIAGYREDDVLGESPQMLLPEGTGAVFDEGFWQTLADQMKWEGDIIIENKDSQRLVVNATVTVLQDAENETEGFVIVLSDITERIQREQDLEDREEELDLLQQILIRYLRHNMRNGLNVIQGNAELLKEDETLSEKQRQLVETIIGNSEDLIKKSETARTYSSLLGRDAELSPFDLSTITTEAVQRVKQDHPRVTFDLDVPETCEIRAREGIQRAIEELIDNAARHNDATEPWVRVRVRDHDAARLVIEDNGPGIPDQEIKSLTKGTETKLTHSQGVGLWLSKWLLQGVDGDLSIELTDTGTRITADFPPIATVGSTVQEVTTLKERERRLQTITDRMTDAVLQIDADMNVTRLDGQAERIFDLTGDPVIGQSLWDAFPDLRETQFETIVRNAMESRSSTTVEQYYSRIDAWLEFTVYPEFTGGLSFYTRDITDRKEREQQVVEMKERYETLLEAAPDPVIVADAETGEIIEVSGAAETLFEMPSDEIVGLHQSDLHPPDQAESYRELFEEHIQSGRTLRRLPDGSAIHIVTANGDHIPVEISVSTVSLPDGPVMYGIFRDISEQVERQQELEATNRRLTVVLEGTNAGIWEWDMQTNEVYWTETLEKLLGLEPGTFEGTFEAFAKRIHPDEKRDTVAVIEAAAESEGSFQMEFRMRCDDGSQIWVESRGTVLEVSDATKRMVGIVTDITERKNREKELELADTVFQKTQDALFLIDVGEDGEFYIQRVNETYETLTGFDAATIRGKTPAEVVGPELGAEIESRYRECVEQRETIQYLEEIPIDGEPKQWETKLTPVIENGRVSHLVGAMQDISERRERQQELEKQTRQLEAIVQNTEEAIYIKDRAGYYQFINESGADLFDMSAEEVIGKHDDDLFDAESAADIRSEDETVMESGQAVRKETVRYIDGEKHVFLDAKYPYRDEDGDVIGLIGISPDITERKERE